MAKFHGVIGYVETLETEPGIWEEQITERPYDGDLTRNTTRSQNSDGVNKDINIANDISIVADPYATEHFFAIRYVKFYMPKLGGAWQVSNVEVKSPRLILTVGGVYNGEQARAAE